MKKLLLFLIIMALFTLVLAACGGGDTTITDEDADKILEEYLKEETAKYVENIKFDSIRMQNDDIVVLFNNENDKYVSLNYVITYYDSEDAELTTKEGFAEVSANSTRVPSIVKSSIIGISYYDHYKIELGTIVELIAKKDQRDNVGFENSHITEDKGVEVTFRNNTDEQIDDASAICLFYNEGNCVGAKYDMLMDIEARGTELMSFDDPDIEYDNYEILLGLACTDIDLGF